MMWPFKKKKKKIYKVEYRDAWGDYNACVVKAYDKYDAWRAVEERYAYRWVAEAYISIEELKED